MLIKLQMSLMLSFTFALFIEISSPIIDTMPSMDMAMVTAMAILMAMTL